MTAPDLATDPAAYMAHVTALAAAGNYCVDCGEDLPTDGTCLRCNPDEPAGAGDGHAAWRAAHPAGSAR